MPWPWRCWQHSAVMGALARSEEEPLARREINLFRTMASLTVTPGTISAMMRTTPAPKDPVVQITEMKHMASTDGRSVSRP